MGDGSHYDWTLLMGELLSGRLPNRWVLDGFSIPIIKSRKLHFKKAFLGTLRKLLHGLAEHTRKYKKSNISAELNTIFKNIVLQDLRP
jgi:hypothetical protein